MFIDPLVGPWAGHLAGIAVSATTSAPAVVVQVNDPTSSNDLYVMFNVKTGINSGTQEVGSQVLIVSTASGEGTTYA